MPADRPERPPTARFLAALEVKRNAGIGLAIGTLLAATLYVFFVAIPLGTRENPLYYLTLAFVLAVTFGAILAVALTIVTAIRLSQRLEEEEQLEAS